MSTNNNNQSFARFKSFNDCTGEMCSLGHTPNDADTICSVIRQRAYTGALLKADAKLEVLTKADSSDIIIGGYASYDCVDREGDIFTVEAQSKALQKFLNYTPENRLITINHGRGIPGEINIASPVLKYTAKNGITYYTHVNEKGTYLLVKMRSDDMVATQHYREIAKNGGFTGYSVNAFVLAQDPANPKRVLDMEYSAVTLTCDTFKPVNPMATAKTLSKAVLKDKPDVACEETKISSVEEILARYGFNKTII